ncbi:unnamed protein product [Didymodactylos carnosus]|uniref:Glycosyltransferase family 92 protein n=1 Tax=Didymodactylos carnosus TaxID=1234261 RepID=A0A8S2RXU4_9BILA|nr:unnamed protein product [Didymodactylos carnosus]CAF4194669.1 unnamed protein product [Didymodactylos carnosus]
MHNKPVCKIRFPDFNKLHYNNIYWQQLQTKNGTFYLYRAYYDDRSSAGKRASVRIIAMIDRIKPEALMCQLWFNKLSSPILSPASYICSWYFKWGNYVDDALIPYIITCKIPKFNNLTLVPQAVSLVERICLERTNILRVTDNRPSNKKKEEFAVCVKGLDFLEDNISHRLIEWIELITMLGAKKIFFYVFHVNSNVTKVLNYYEKIGKVELRKITLPGRQPNLPSVRHLYLKQQIIQKRQNELIPYNDCLYQNLYMYDYLALLDIDEIIMPLKHDNWSQLLIEIQELNNFKQAGSYSFRHVYFLDDFVQKNSTSSTHLHMLNHVYRSRNYSKPLANSKCFHNTSHVLSLHNHFPLVCVKQCKGYHVSEQLAHLQHYRKACPPKRPCNKDPMDTVRDTTIFKYKDELIRRTEKVMNHLNVFLD